jgi:Outer membrane protein beta-barrel domain
MRKAILGANVLVLAMFSCVEDASAQIWRRAGVGGSVGWVQPTDRDVEVGTVFGVLFGLKPQEGFGLTGGLGWFGADLFLEDVAGPARIGRMQVRPIMVGLGYTWVTGRVATSTSFVAGISFNDIDLESRILTALGPGTTLDVGNSFAMRPSVEVEYELARKLAISATLGYFYSQPDTRLTSPPAVNIADRWDASMVTFTLGVMVYPFQ